MTSKNKTYQVFNNRGKKWTPEEDQLLIQRFKAGNKPAVLAELHGRSDNAIRSRLKKLNVIY
jgi:hypothetical protein